MPTDPSLQLMVKEGDVGGVKVAVLTSPISLEGESDVNYRAPNLIQRILSLLKSVRPGTDLTRFQLPPLFNIPKSQLQCYGESVYCVGDNLLTKIANGESSIERFTSVVAWSISTMRPLAFGVAPYNPILGETHHVSRGNLNVLLEQVSHHPPVSALHATDEKDNVELLWCQYPTPKFHGTSVETEVCGKRLLKLLSKGESYVMNSPKLVIRFLPFPRVDWVGSVTIRCPETDLEAEFCYRTNSFLGRRTNHRAINGKIFMSSSLKTIYEINGHWDRTITIKDASNGKVTVIYNAKDMISGLKTPIANNPEGVWASESAVVWGQVSESILKKNWEKAKEAKTALEEIERELLRGRNARGETWVPKHFTVSYSKESGWDCSPNMRWVPPAPIVVPL
ncbi:oxysterol-binding protein-related protein 4C-like [Cornus florida]|uniref:oxysterol-binding protein-related protein 4C-like n=1 Tax=Cornus florida TaxID=4283 RepID=UPI002898480E|nr:oxysterol-binding protein-related protein 4C-like [Cornus florida]